MVKRRDESLGGLLALLVVFFVGPTIDEALFQQFGLDGQCSE